VSTFAGTNLELAYVTVSRWFPRARAPYAILLVAVGLTILGTYYVQRTGRARDDLHFHATAEETRHLVEIRLHTYIEVLRAAVALFGASEQVTADEFRAFVSALRLGERYPGIQGIGFAARLPNDGGAIPLWPKGDRDEYTSIVYLEPLDVRNQRAIGYDMFSDPIRRAAMERARDTGEPAASGKVTLVQEFERGNTQAGFLIYVPVYERGRSPETVEERRAALVGYVFSPFRANDLLRGILGPGGLTLAFSVFDGSIIRPENLMHVSAVADDSSDGEALKSTYTIDVAGRAWTLVFTGPRHFDGSAPAWIAPLTLFGGLIVSLALFGVVAAQSRARHEAEQHAAEVRASEEALRESEARLRRLVVLEREARAEAQAADRAKDEFLATLSHELRTPLNAMLGWITMLRAGKVREDRRVDALEVIERNARTQARLIEDLLDVSRIITGNVRLELQAVDFASIVRAVMESLRPSAEAKNIQLHVAIASGVRQIQGDPSRLQQILWNLVANAIKFTPAEGRMSVAVNNAAGGVELSVCDTGIGIEADFLPHVFERFRQADSSATRAHGGVGLGLAIVRHLVDLHGGRISAESEGRDRGSRFIVWLPVAPVTTRAANPEQHTAAVH
jgi:signal transduction histidine kinase